MICQTDFLALKHAFLSLYISRTCTLSPTDTHAMNGSVTACSALYNQTVQLNCSVSSGIWFKNGCVHSVCQKSSCTLTDLSFSASSGLYFCQATDLILFVNLTINGKEINEVFLVLEHRTVTIIIFLCDRTSMQLMG